MYISCRCILPILLNVNTSAAQISRWIWESILINFSEKFLQIYSNMEIFLIPDSFLRYAVCAHKFQKSSEFFKQLGRCAAAQERLVRGYVYIAF